MRYGPTIRRVSPCDCNANHSKSEAGVYVRQCMQTLVLTNAFAIGQPERTSAGTYPYPFQPSRNYTRKTGHIDHSSPQICMGQDRTCFCLLQLTPQQLFMVHFPNLPLQSIITS